MRKNAKILEHTSFPVIRVFNDYTDALMVLIVPVIGAGLLAVLGIFRMPNWITVAGSVGLVSCVQWRVYLQTRVAHADLRSSLFAFAAKNGLILIWIFVAILWLTWNANNQRPTKKSQSLFRTRNDEESWCRLVGLILGPVIALLLIHRLTRVHRFSSLWDYLGAPVNLKQKKSFGLTMPDPAWRN